MAAYIKYSLLLGMCISAFHNGYANTIDSLSTKEEVRQFLVTNLGRKGIIFLTEFAEISVVEKQRMWFSRYFHRFDTVLIEDPVSNKLVKTVIENDSNSYHTDLETRPFNYPFD